MQSRVENATLNLEPFEPVNAYGDHSPRHVHVYKDAKLIVKWDLENGKAMKGKANRRVLEFIRQLQNEGLL